MLQQIKAFCRHRLTIPPRRAGPRHRQPFERSTRRGVLLLVVVSMLTLFLMLGATYLSISSRARRVAKAFDAATMTETSADADYPQMLDTALLHFLRGAENNNQPSLPAGSSGLTLLPFESLLEDKYGKQSHISGTASQSLFAILVTGQGPESPKSIESGVRLLPTAPNSLPAAPLLPGRLLTLLGDGAKPTTHRILRVDGSGGNASLVISKDGDVSQLGWTKQQPNMQQAAGNGSGITIAIGQVNLWGQTARAVLNGREFDASGQTNEAWDGFDDANPFLTHLAPSSISVGVSEVKKAAFVQSGTSNATLALLNSYASDGLDYAADNDNDGVKDAFYLDIGLPKATTPDGGVISLHASALIVDLDSRYNVNAHGSLAALSYPSTHPGWSTSIDLSNTPIGSGYGPAEVSPAGMFKSNFFKTATLASNEDPLRCTTAGVSATDYLGRRPSGSRFGNGNGTTFTPRLSVLEGRYGEPDKIGANSAGLGSLSLSDNNYPLARPGQRQTDDLLSRVSDLAAPISNGTISLNLAAGIPPTWWNGSSGFNWTASLDPLPSPRASYNSPPDLHGNMKTTTAAGSGSGIVPKVTYAKPDWGAFETTDDPYELPLANRHAQSSYSSGLRNASLDNIYSHADLEAVLRPYDADSLLLPLRLSSLLGSATEESRLKVTTAAWDTTMITGTAASKLTAWLGTLSGSVSGTSALSGIINGEISRGERFNISRPLTGDKPTAYSATSLYYVQRQAYFKDLYTLLVALGRPENAEVAQWAANVVEFRDADSTMTPFEYDTNIGNGWTVDNDAKTKNDPERAVVWGSERPEMLITHTSAWENESTGELFIGLHRPWNAIALGSESASIPAEPIDAALDAATPSNVLDLGRKSNRKSFTDTDTYPIWRLRIVDDAGTPRYCRFDTDASTADSFTSTEIGSAADTPKLGADKWICIQRSNTQGAIIDPAFKQTTFSGLRVPGTAKAAGTNRTATIYLERLSDPAAEVTAAIWSQDPATSDTVPMYRVVDKASVQVVNRKVDPVTGVIPPTQITSIMRRKTTGATALWKIDPPCPAPDSAFTSQATVTIAPPTLSSDPSNNPAWFVWPNRPLISAAELFLVPAGDAVTMLTQYSRPTAGTTGLASMNCPELLDAVHVPTRFSGVHDTLDTAYSDGLAAYAGIYSETAPVNQLSAFREPGRVNVNTITNDDVWNAVVAGPLTVTGTAANKGAPQPVASRTAAGLGTTPARTFANLLALSGTAAVSAIPTQDIELEDRNGNGVLDPGEDLNGNNTLDAVRLPKTLNPAHAFYTANRLANAATIRSNVFAIWITVRSSVDGDADSVRLHRAFYIVDRSIPVAFESGKDYNVWDAVILRRIIE